MLQIRFLDEVINMGYLLSLYTSVQSMRGSHVLICALHIQATRKHLHLQTHIICRTLKSFLLIFLRFLIVE